METEMEMAAPERVEGNGRGKMAAMLYMYKKERGQKRKDDSVPKGLGIGTRKGAE